MYSVENRAYPGNCAITLNLPVVEDGDNSIAVTLFRRQLQIGNNFPITLDQAIQAADRHVYIDGMPDNPVAFVEDWVNLLRWEVSNLWKIDTAHSRIEKEKGLNLTHEHYKRSGEILAEGLAISFLEERLKARRQNFFFFNGAGARPDFVANLNSRHQMALAVNRNRFAIEVRSRAGKDMRNISGKGKAELKAKKDNMKGIAGVISIYCCYGMGEHTDDNATSHTRIHLADPPVENTPEASDVEIAEIAIHHYLRLTSQLGLWDHRDHLMQAAKLAAKGELLSEQMQTNTIRRGISREFGNQNFRGRQYSELIEFAHREPETSEEMEAIKSEVQGRVDAGFFGTMVFRGLNVVVIKLIEKSDWLALAEFRDEGATPHKVDTWVRSDGLFRSEARIEPNSQEANDVLTQIRSKLE